MRYFYVMICGLGSGLAAHAQQAAAPAAPSSLAPDSAWYEAADERRVSSSIDSVGACTEVLRWENDQGLLRVFYPSGHLREYSSFGSLEAGARHGTVSTWFDNGQMQTLQAYEQGRRTGPLLVYYENGALKRRTDYVAGNELPGSCFDEAGVPVAYFPYEQLPLYPGGQAQLVKEITGALRLPRRATDYLLWEPRVVGIEFQVKEDGRIVAPRVARSSQVPDLDGAVLATVARLTKRFSPGRRDGRQVAYTFYLPVQLQGGKPRGLVELP